MVGRRIMDYRIAACLSLSLTVRSSSLVLLYFYPFLSSIAFLSVPFSPVLSIAIFSHILYVRALTDTCKLFQGPYYFVSLLVLLLYFYHLSSISYCITISSTKAININCTVIFISSIIIIIPFFDCSSLPL